MARQRRNYFLGFAGTSYLSSVGTVPQCRAQMLLHCGFTDVAFAEKLGTSFLIVRSDIQGNIDRLSLRQQSDPSRYRLLYAIVLDEVRNGDTGNSSCTKGLLWLQRCASAGPHCVRACIRAYLPGCNLTRRWSVAA